MAIGKEAPAFADQSNQAFSAGQHCICIANQQFKELQQGGFALPLLPTLTSASVT